MLDHPKPQRNGQRCAQEIAAQKSRFERFGCQQAVLHKKQDERRRYRAGDTVEQKHRQQTAKRDALQWQPHTGGFKGWLGARPHGARPGQPAPTQRDEENAHRCRQPQRDRCDRSHQHADQAKALAPRHDAAALRFVAAQHGPPRLVGDAQRTVGAVGQHQEHHEPDHHIALRLRLWQHREKQQGEARAQKHGGHCAKHQHRADGARKQAIAQATQQRVNERIEQARNQQNCAQCPKANTKLPRVEIGQNHIQRQRHKGQRQAQQAIAHAIAPAFELCGCAHCAG